MSPYLSFAPSILDKTEGASFHSAPSMEKRNDYAETTTFAEALCGCLLSQPPTSAKSEITQAGAAAEEPSLGIAGVGEEVEGKVAQSGVASGNGTVTAGMSVSETSTTSSDAANIVTEAALAEGIRKSVAIDVESLDAQKMRLPLESGELKSASSNGTAALREEVVLSQKMAGEALLTSRTVAESRILRSLTAAAGETPLLAAPVVTNEHNAELHDLTSMPPLTARVTQSPAPKGSESISTMGTVVPSPDDMRLAMLQPDAARVHENAKPTVTMHVFLVDNTQEATKHGRALLIRGKEMPPDALVSAQEVATTVAKNGTAEDTVSSPTTQQGISVGLAGEQTKELSSQLSPSAAKDDIAARGARLQGDAPAVARSKTLPEETPEHISVIRTVNGAQPAGNGSANAMPGYALPAEESPQRRWIAEMRAGEAARVLSSVADARARGHALTKPDVTDDTLFSPSSNQVIREATPFETRYDSTTISTQDSGAIEQGSGENAASPATRGTHNGSTFLTQKAISMGSPKAVPATAESGTASRTGEQILETANDSLPGIVAVNETRTTPMPPDTNTGAVTTVKLPSVVEQVVAVLHIAQNRPSREVTLRLVPPSLGEVRIKVENHGDNLTVYLASMNAAVCRQLEGQVSQLYHLLTTVTPGVVSVYVGTHWPHEKRASSDPRPDSMPASSVGTTETEAQPLASVERISAPRVEIGANGRRQWLA